MTTPSVAEAAPSLSSTRRTLGGVSELSNGSPQQAVRRSRPRVALRRGEGARTFDRSAGGPSAWVWYGTWAAWFHKEALLLRGQSDSEGAESAAARIRVSAEEMPRIAGYELQRQIGRGGSATVYLAREIKHDRQVALKVLHPALAASIQSERFLREISIVAKLSHPHILPLLDSGTVGDTLYYVTPYVAGESLRALLEREKSLPVKEASRLTREVAEALDHAHRHGVIHRDVKPENILLADGHALVADFGIARAVHIAADDRLTASDLTPGTPRYMSPEQASGVEADARSDIYSLGCVLYEMLTGRPPFVGSMQEVLGQHRNAAVPPIPAHLGLAPSFQRAVARALEKNPDSRYASSVEFASVLADPVAPRFIDWIRILNGRRATNLMMLTGGVAAAVILALRVSATTSLVPLRDRFAAALGIRAITLDTTTYLLVANGNAPPDAVTAVTQAMKNAIDRWREITVLEETPSATPENVSAADYHRARRRTAYALEAGRYVVLSVSNTGDSLRLSATVLDTRTGQPLAETEASVASQLTGFVDTALVLSDALMFRGSPVGRLERNAGTNSFVARRSFLSGHAALANGEFSAADSAFRTALAVDPEYPQALVWLSNVRSWSRSFGPWRELPSRARSRRAALSSRDSVLLDALLLLAADRIDQACASWRGLTRLAPDDFTAWYGLGQCLRADSAVVRDPLVRGGWRFRSSLHESVRAFERAFQIQPNVLLGFRGGSLSELRLLMLTSGAYTIPGVAVAPDTMRFRGYRVWESDSLVMLPLSGAQAPTGPGTSSMDEAVQRQRLRFRDIALMWKSEFPRSPDAIEAVAAALEMLGDEAALDTLQRARAFAIDSDDRLRLASNEVLMRMKFSAPHNVASLLAAKRLADSVLATNPPSSSAYGELLSSLAALTGRANLAASYARLVGGDAGMPALARTGPALLAFASMGGPADSVSILAAAVDRGVRSLPESQRATGRRDWLTRSAVLGFPEVRLASFPDSGNTGLRLGNMIAAVLSGDTVTVLRMNRDIAQARRWLRPSDLTSDGVYPEAASLNAIGAHDLAIDRLDPTLLSLQFTASQDFAYVNRTGPLVRAMVLRAQLAERKNDRATARLWASAVVTLWSEADPFLQPVVRAMRQLMP
jgi:tRNA A-37 threonylcarbamoyl transferase component Bud32/tetratricopeptide (TPR) repeat protein